MTVKDKRLTARVSPALHTLALDLGNQSSVLRAALLIAAGHLGRDMPAYTADILAVLGEDLAPEMQAALHTLYLTACAPDTPQPGPPQVSLPAAPAPGAAEPSSGTRSSALPVPTEAHEHLEQGLDDILQSA